MGISSRPLGGNSIEQTVDLMVLENACFVEPLDESATVITGADDAIVFELDHGFLDRDSAQSQILDDPVPVDAVPRSHFAGQDQIDHVRDNEIFLLDAVLLRHDAPPYAGGPIALSAPFSTALPSPDGIQAGYYGVRRTNSSGMAKPQVKLRIELAQVK